jgi:hypothetical protein
MPSNLELKTLWNQQGVLGGAGESTLFYPGELGKTQWHKASDVTAAGQLQPIRLRKVLRYASDTLTADDGHLAYYLATDGFRDFVVTADISQALGGSTSPQIAGVFRGAGPTAGYYGIIQDLGPANVNKATNTAWAAGSFVVADSVSGQGVCAAPSSTTQEFLEVVGRCVAAATTSAAHGLVILYDDAAISASRKVAGD